MRFDPTPFALSPSKPVLSAVEGGLHDTRQGFDRLSPNGGVRSMRFNPTPFALSLSKPVLSAVEGGLRVTRQGFDELSPNGSPWKAQP